MTPVRIIGIGSDRVDDRIGWDVLKKLQQTEFATQFAPGLVSFQTCRFPAQLLQLLEGCRLAVLIDAIPAEPGALLDIDVNHLLTCKTLHSSHGIGVGEALQLVERLFEQPPDIRLLGIGVGGNGETDISDERMHALQLELIERLGDAIENHVANGALCKLVVAD